MLFKILPILVVIGTALALLPVQHKTLMDIMLQPSTVNSKTTENCFDYYIPMLNELSRKNDRDVNDCKQNSATESDEKECTLKAYASYQASTAAVYDKLSNCLQGNGII